MIWKLGLAALVLAGLALVLAHKGVPRVWAGTGSEGKPVLITAAIDESRLIRLRGNTRPEANAKNDRGRVEDSFPMEHMLLQLKRAPELEQEFDQYIDGLTDKSSPNFRHWMMAAGQGEKYGLAQQDIDSITGWLGSHGFTVGYVYPNLMVIDFSGTAAQIREAFHTEIHYLEVGGEQHFANMTDPKIPAALAPAVVGVVSMHNFKPQQMRVPRVRKDYTFSGCAGGTNGTGGSCYALVPADFQTIYNLNPLYREQIDGRGQTITIVEDSDTYTPSGGTNDVTVYRNTFLSKYTLGSVTTVHPTGSAACTDPGTNAADGEADLDAEVASAIAPNATIVVATCADTTTFGGLLAIENLVTSATPPAIISMSYGVCEAANYLPSNAAFNTAFQTAAAAGTSIFVSAGDAGGSACAPDFTGGDNYSFPGIGVTGWGESVYNVSVGGTDFEDAYNAKEVGTPLSIYWNSTNTSTDGSAKSYIPEIPWNDSCAGYLLYNYEGYAAPYGPAGFCNSTIATTGNAFLSTAAGGGGPSACATGGGDTNQTNYLEVDGKCAGYAKPSWQSGIFGNPADGVRDIPDVSLFASNGIWGHYVTVCFSDTTQGGTSCVGAPSTWSGFGGTSVATPMMAAIQALVNEKWSLSKVGNPNPTYYAIAKTEFGSTGNSSCYSINQPPRRGLASSCVFYDITQGDNNVDCRRNGTAHRVGCFDGTSATTQGTISTQPLTTGTVIAGGSGYTTAPTCTLGAPSNLNEYLSPTNVILWAGGKQATCTAAISGGAVSSITITAVGDGYAGGTSCTITGGGGSGATCSVSPTVGTLPATYEPAYGATPGWDFATGIGSVNAYNLVFNSAW
jgi:subtilase family serine protease